MADINIPYGGGHIAAFEQGDNYHEVELFAGSTPLPVTDNYPVAAGTALEAFAVVGLSGGNLVMANNGAVTAIGVTTAAVTDDGSADSVAVFLAGCFNPDVLVWDAAYATDAEKKAAFAGADSPTNILVKSTSK